MHPADKIFCTISPSSIAKRIESAIERVVLVAPGIYPDVAEAIIRLHTNRKDCQVSIVIDCSEQSCRIGYGDIGALRKLLDSGVSVRQSAGSRIGLVVVDDDAWFFTPSPLSVEAEPQSDETPNGVRIDARAIKSVLDAIIPLTGSESTSQLSGSTEPEIGSAHVTHLDVAEVEQSLAIAPPLAFDVSRVVRVFSPYILYVEISLEGCAIGRRRVTIPQEILNVVSDATLKERIRTTFDLIQEGSPLSDAKLRHRVDEVRNNFSKHVGKSYGRIMLRGQRKALDSEIGKLRQEVATYQATATKALGKEIDKSIAAVVKACARNVVKKPPLSLLYQVPPGGVTLQVAKEWLSDKLRLSFPKPEEIVSQMKLDVVYKDVTYENLCDADFQAALKKSFPWIPWQKPFSEFDAAARMSNTADNGSKRSQMGLFD